MPLTLVLLVLGLIGFTASAIFIKKRKASRIVCMVLCAAAVILSAVWMGLTAYFERAARQEDDPAVTENGGDWRTWRSYTGDYAVKEDLSVTLSPLDGRNGYAVYNASTGERIGTLHEGSGQEEILCEDIDRDGICELGIALSEETIWYRYTDTPWVEGTGGGCFERVE